MSEPRTFTDEFGVEFVGAEGDGSLCGGCAFKDDLKACVHAAPCYSDERPYDWVWKRKESK